MLCASHCGTSQFISDHSRTSRCLSNQSIAIIILWGYLSFGLPCLLHIQIVPLGPASTVLSCVPQDSPAPLGNVTYLLRSRTEYTKEGNARATEHLRGLALVDQENPTACYNGHAKPYQMVTSSSLVDLISVFSARRNTMLVHRTIVYYPVQSSLPKYSIIMLHMK